jgi:SAM-dependent methyltransferase
MSEPQDNTAERDYWNGPGGERWAAAQDRADRNLAAITEAALAFAAPRPGDRVLDVGCGCGTTSVMLRERVGAGGRVVGLDFSHPMIQVARARGGNVEYVEADASTYAFSAGGFDLLFSRFGVMFFADPVAAFANLRRGLAPGGRAAFVCFRDPAANPWATQPLEAARDLLPDAKPRAPGAPGPFAFADPDRVTGILAGAGFTKIRLEPHDCAMHLGDTIDEALDGVFELGPLAGAAAEASAATRAIIRERVRPVLERHRTPRGIEPAAAVWFVGATA